MGDRKQPNPGPPIGTVKPDPPPAPPPRRFPPETLHPNERCDLIERHPRDETMPAGRFSFDESVTDVFDDMLRRSIPQYEVMRKTCFDLGRSFVKPRTSIVDIGCSRGEALAPFVREFGAYNTYVGIDVSQPMLDAFRERFRSLIDVGVVRALETDLRNSLHFGPASLILSVLTLQFTPIEHRPRILADLRRELVPDGALVLVEKVIGRDQVNDHLFSCLYHDHKRAMGYTEEQIDRKRLALEGVLVPMTARFNEEMLTDAGFSHVECFWRWCNFAGWIAVR